MNNKHENREGYHNLLSDTPQAVTLKSRFDSVVRQQILADTHCYITMDFKVL